MNKTKITFLTDWGSSPQYCYDFYNKFNPNDDGCYNNLESVLTVDEADVVFIMQGTGNLSLPADMIRKLKTKRIYVIVHEPPNITSNLGIHRIPEELREQAILVDCFSQPIWYLSKGELIHSHKFHDFLDMEYTERTKKLSCIVSGKQYIPGHKSRLRFINELISKEPNLLTLYGRNNLPTNKGSLDANKKYLAYEGFEYTLCFENNRIPYYFSDKIFDSLLMWSMPIYWGAPNIGEHLPPDSFHMLGENLDSVDIEKVKDICKNPPTKRNIEAMKEARELIVNKYSMWPTFEYILKEYE